MSDLGPSPEFELRAKRFWLATHGPSFRATLLSFGSAVVFALATVAVIVATRDPGLSTLVALAGATAAVLVTLSPFRDESSRLATELVRDHEHRESDEWTARFGVPMPCSRKDLERWLLEHPPDEGHVAVLTNLGRLDEAERVLDARIIRTAEDGFDTILQRAQINLFRGRAPDIDLLRTQLADIPDPRRQAARRQCIVGLQAWQAAERGDDALAILARGRRVIGLLDPASSIERQMWRLVWFPVMIAGVVLFGVVIGTR